MSGAGSFYKRRSLMPELRLPAEVVPSVLCGSVDPGCCAEHAWPVTDNQWCLYCLAAMSRIWRLFYFYVQDLRRSPQTGIFRRCRRRWLCLSDQISGVYAYRV